MSAPRITAAYDDGAPREHVFARVADNAAAAAFDLESLADGLARALTVLCGSAARVTVSAAPPDVRRLDWQVRDDGLQAGCGGGLGLAAALSSVSCGGGFAADDVPSGAPSLTRARRRVAAAVRAALDDGELPGMWSAAGASAAGAIAAPAMRFDVTVGCVADTLDVAVAVPPTPLPADWTPRLRARLDALAVPVRIVLHDGPIPVREARALAVGSVLPIATAHAVGLRVGTNIVARGRVDAGDDTPRIEIVSVGGRP